MSINFDRDIFLSETFLYVAITNINEGRSPQIQALSSTQNELMGVLCERGKIMKIIFYVSFLRKICNNIFGKKLFYKPITQL